MTLQGFVSAVCKFDNKFHLWKNDFNIMVYLMQLLNLKSGRRIPFPIIYCNFSKLDVGLERIGILSPSSAFGVFPSRIMSDTSCKVRSNTFFSWSTQWLITWEILDFFFSVMDASFLRRLIVFLSSDLGDTCYNSNGGLHLHNDIRNYLRSSKGFF